MQRYKSAFTLLELVFVIVVIGILAAVAVPKFMVTRTDAIIVKGKSNVSAIRNGIALQKSRNMLKGINPPYPSSLDNAPANTAHASLFSYGDGNISSILQYPIYSKKNMDGHWWKESLNKYDYFVTQDKNISFDYNSSTGSFDCDHSIQNCKNLTE